MSQLHYDDKSIKAVYIIMTKNKMRLLKLEILNLSQQNILKQ